MRFPSPISVRTIAAQIGAEILGDQEQYAHGINEIHKVEPGDVTFVDIEKYYNKSLNSAATIIIINKKVDCPAGKTLLYVEHAFEAYDQIVLQHRPFLPATSNIAASAKVHPTAIIEPNVTIGHHVVIGADCYLQSHCYIGNYTQIGDRVTIQAGTVIGTDAFYFKQKGTEYHQWCSGGNVVIEDDVYIGASSTINKGVSGSTVIGKGSKIDCQVHLGHGVVIGKHCLLAGQVGIGGKTVLGDRVKVYGQCGIGNNLTIGDDAVFLGQSGVTRSQAGGKTYFGLPAEEARKKYAQLVALRNLVKK